MAKIIVPENEYKITFSRARGKGGQNVNKVSTKVNLRWNVLESDFLDEEQRRRVLSYLKNKVDKNGNFIIYSQSERSQWQNREETVDKFNKILSKALKPPKKRVPTGPTRASKERKLEEKKRKSEKKELRQKIRDYK